MKRFVTMILFFVIVINCMEVPVYGHIDKNMELCDYPISIHSGEWNELTYKKKLELCNLSTDILEKLSTEDLAELVLDYPFLIDVFTFNSAEGVLKHFEETSTVMKEFFSRNDSQEVLLQKYDGLNVDYSLLSKANNISKNSVMYDSGYIKEVFLQTYFSTKISSMEEEKKKNLVDIIGKKHKEKTGYCEDFASAYTLYSNIQKEMGFITKNIIPDNMLLDEKFEGVEQSIQTISYQSSTMNATEIYCRAQYQMTTYTKYGVTVNLFMYKSNDFTTAEKAAINSQIMEVYPTWILKATATQKYNCHSYAWISTDTSNNVYWLNNPDKFRAQRTYFNHIGVDVMPKKGDIVVILSETEVNDGFGGTTHSVHSMIALDDNGTMISKVAVAGLYKTTLNEMMTYYNGVHYNVYRMK